MSIKLTLEVEDVADDIPTLLESYNILSRSAWLALQFKQLSSINHEQPSVWRSSPVSSKVADFESAEYLSDILNFGGFMADSLAFHNGTQLEIKTISSSDISEIKSEFAQSGSLIFLRSVNCVCPFVEFSTWDDEKFQKVYVDPPVIRPPLWHVRYAIAGDSATSITEI